MKLNRSFFSLYFIIVFIFIVFTWLLDEVWSSYLEQDIESYTGYKTMLAAVGGYLQKHPQEEWPEIIEKTGDKFELNFSLMALSDLDNGDRKDKKSLRKGNTYVYYDNDEVMLHHLLEGTNTLLTLGPTKMPTRPRVESLIRVLLMALLGGIIFYWLRPMSRDLDQLRKSTGQFGDGNLGIQAPTAKSTMIKPMVSAFNMMAQRIKQLIEAHQELTNAVAHELRTPLARSKFALQMLSTSKDATKQAKYREQISSDINELEELINEMLLYAKFDSDKPTLLIQEYSIGKLINDQLANYQHFTGSIVFENKIGLDKISCDAHFILRAVNNYINNAVKYGGSQIKVTLLTNDSDCIITVEDDGEGVSDELKPVIFDAFSRGDKSRNRETGGFGLGLAIVSRIMEWHQGSVDVVDSELGGACFVLSWPLKQ
ncbi:MAG: two-component sensor histidine kinase [Colwellia sp.]|nr:two-component sensor histidine kinase [Colwellia sp.]